MKLYQTRDGLVLIADDEAFRLDETLDDLLSGGDLAATLREKAETSSPLPAAPDLSTLLAPIGTQELWGTGVTYYRSREARIAEAHDTGGSDFYDRVYHAERPEIFFKAPASRVVGPGGTLRLRRDSSWVVPEPELTLVLSASGSVAGYTIANDLSCRDIEAENPLYLPQAKTYDACAGLGPCILVSEKPLSRDTIIELEIRRKDGVVFSGATSLSQMKREFSELAAYLFAETSFPNGCFLMTGTGIVPPDDFTLLESDVVRITVAAIGTLENRMSPGAG